MIELFAGTTTTFTGRNGDVILLPTACSVTAEVNGVWELRLEHPLDEEGRWRYIATSAILRVPSHNGKQLFRIKRVEKSETAVVAQADPIFFDAGNDCFMMDTRAVNKTAQEALNLIFSGSPAYSGLSDIQRTSTAYYVRKNALEAISGDENSILNRWGGELEYDNFTVRVMQRLGADRGVLVRTGKNLPRDGLQYAADESEVINRIVPLSYNGHKMSGSTPWVDASGVTAAIRHVGVVTFEDIRLGADTGYAPGETVPDYITVCANQSALDAALTAAAQDYFTKTKCYMPKVEIEAEIAVLQAFNEYADYEWVEQVSLGDTVYLYNPNIGIGVEDGAYDPLPIRVREIEWDCIHDRAARIVARSEESSVSYSGASTNVGSADSVFDVDTAGNIVMGDKLIFGGTDVAVPAYIQRVPGNTNGSVIMVRPGGPLIVGGGEYASARWGAGDISATNETAFLGSDSNVYIESNGNTIANRKTWTFGASGDITTPAGGLINGVDITKLCNYGTVETLSPAASIPTGTSWQNVMSFDLTPGLWFLEFTARFASNATGYRGINISTASGGSAQTYLLQDLRRPASGTYTFCKIAATYRTASTVTRYLNAVQNSGNALTMALQYKLTLLKGE